MSLDKWEALAAKLYLNSDESEVLYNWRREQNTQNCLDMFLVFKAHHKAKEAEELLSWSLVFQPKKIETLVRLSREFFELGNFAEAWHCLQRNTFEVKKNATGLNTYFLSSLALGKKDLVAFSAQELERDRAYDSLSSKILNTYKELGFEAARKAIFNHFHDRRMQTEPRSCEALALAQLRKPLSAQLAGKLGTCSLKNHGVSDQPDFTEDKLNAFMLRKLEKLEKRLELLWHMKNKMKKRY